MVRRLVAPALTFAVVVAVQLGAAEAAPVGGLAVSAPATLTIVEHGRFPIPPSGTFESSAPFCASGTWRDTSDRSNGVRVYYQRVHTCGDGSGTIVLATIVPDHKRVPLETWVGDATIVRGTGAYEHLRGKGRVTGVRHDEVAFTDTWRGLVDFDDVAPQARIGAVVVKRVTQKGRTFSLRVPVSARDNVAENAVSYELTILADATAVAKRSGTLPTGSATLGFSRVKPGVPVRRLQLVLVAHDPLGNERTARKTIALPAGT